MAGDSSQRLKSTLYAQGAEFLVLAHLLLEDIHAQKAYTNMPGYDLIASNPEAGTSCRIQVKSRWATDSDRTFPIKNLDCDFLVLAELNRGYRYSSRRATPEDGRHPPALYVVPTEIIRPVLGPPSSGGWGTRLHLRRIPDLESYRERWDLVREHLRVQASKGHPAF